MGQKSRPIRIIICSVFIRKWSSKNNKETILNALNIQLLGKSLSAKVFPNQQREHEHSNLSRIQMQSLELSREHLDSNAIPWKTPRQNLPEVSGDFVPKLLGRDGTLLEHFSLMAVELGEPYFSLAMELSTDLSEGKKSLVVPTFEQFSSLPAGSTGWFHWDSVGKTWSSAPEGPVDKIIVFDVETCPLISQFPVLATAFGPSGWYVWMSQFDANTETSAKSDLDRLIPLEHPILVIGHHVAFDRARLRQEYTLDRSQRRFLDTLSMHCAVAGISSQQRGLWKENQKSKVSKESGEEAEAEDADYEDVDSGSSFHGASDVSTEKWSSKSSLNNLVDSYRLHCGKRLDKGTRDDVLLKATDSSMIIPEIPRILEYCAKDVEATAQLFSILFPKFLKKSPHPVTFTALLEMGNFIAPVDRQSWEKYIADCEKLFEAAKKAIEADLSELAEITATEALKDLSIVENDPWLKQLDWTIDPVKYTKARFLKDGTTYAKNGEPRPIGNPNLHGIPAWYKKILKHGKAHVTPRTSIVPFLLKLKWKGACVHLIPEYGWCIEITANKDDSTAQTPASEFKTIKYNNQQFRRIPHPGGRDENVGCLLTKNFLNFYQSGDLSTDSPLIERVMEINSRFSFWTGYRERIKEQFVVSTDPNSNRALILPTVQPMGTVTRRAVEKTWLTASNAKEKLVGSELKALISAPEGWCFVGADVDSQELWIGSLLGDAQFGWSGSTALGWMTLQGTKSDGTDLHSRTASILGMTRDHAKIFNYGRIYGAGVKYATQLLQKFNPRLTLAEASARASELYHSTKGRRISNRRDAFVSYSGGTESFMFNQMEAIAHSPVSRTPVLSAEISDGLIAEHVDDNFLTSRVNWVVQSSGVDYLHMLLVAIGYLFKTYGISGRVALTIHDEVRFLVPESEKYRAALALQIANLWTRAAFVQAIGVSDLPLSVAFFSAVDVDKVLRKEVNLSCITPSNAVPIAPGVAFDIYKLLEKCKELNSQTQTPPQSTKLENSFMYKFYEKNNNLKGTTSDKRQTIEDEQKYLTILKKQMKQRNHNPNHNSTSTTSMSNNNHSYNRSNSSSNTNSTGSYDKQNQNHLQPNHRHQPSQGRGHQQSSLNTQTKISEMISSDSSAKATATTQIQKHVVHLDIGGGVNTNTDTSNNNTNSRPENNEILNRWSKLIKKSQNTNTIGIDSSKSKSNGYDHNNNNNNKNTNNKK